MSASGRSLGIIAVLCAILLVAGCAGSATDKSTGEYVDDAVITTKVKTALVQSDEVDAIDVKVKTYKGVVQLSGFVDAESEASQAEAVAGQVAGVKRVENQIEVKPGQQGCASPGARRGTSQVPVLRLMLFGRLEQVAPAFRAYLSFHDVAAAGLREESALAAFVAVLGLILVAHGVLGGFLCEGGAADAVQK